MDEIMLAFITANISAVTREVDKLLVKEDDVNVRVIEQFIVRSLTGRTQCPLLKQGIKKNSRKIIDHFAEAIV